MKGIHEHRNPKNNMYVFRVHYTADPGKDPQTDEGKKWVEKAIIQG